MRAAALALCLAAGAASNTSLADWTADMDRAMSETEALLAGLAALRERYGPARADPAFASERDALRADIERRRARIAEREREGRLSVREDALKVGAPGGRDTRLRRALPPDMRALLDAGRTRAAVPLLLTRVGAELERDAEAWRLAGESARRRRILALALPLLGAGLILTAAAFRTYGRGAPPSQIPAPAPAPAAGPPRALAPGSIVGGSYRIIRPLGEDALGTSYEAAGPAAPVVVTRVRDELHRRDGDAERFLAEARRAASLRHPCLAEVLGVFIENDRICIAAQTAGGPSLKELLASGGPLGIAAIKNIVSQAAAVIDHVHEQGLRHGNLRPADILTRADATVLVKDFGLTLCARRILAGSACPPPVDLAYMAPEEELGAGTPASDIYSLGAVIYEMAAGRAPFSGPDFLAQKRAMGWVPLTTLAPSLPAGLDAAVRTALQVDPARRFKTASDLFAALVDLS